MMVTAQYAETHLDELLAATETGQQVDIIRPDKPMVRLTLVAEEPKFDRSAMFGSAKGMIWMADDWDSKETNAEIARLFNDGSVFPE